MKLSHLFFLIPLLFKTGFPLVAAEAAADPAPVAVGPRNFEIISPDHNPGYQKTLLKICLQTQKKTFKTFLIERSLYLSQIASRVYPGSEDSETPTPRELYEYFNGKKYTVQLKNEETGAVEKVSFQELANSMILLSRDIPLTDENSVILFSVEFMTNVISRFELRITDDVFADEEMEKILRKQRDFDLGEVDFSPLLGPIPEGLQVSSGGIDFKSMAEMDLNASYFSLLAQCRRDTETLDEAIEYARQQKPTLEERLRANPEEDHGSCQHLTALLYFNEDLVPQGDIKYFSMINANGAPIKLPVIFNATEEAPEEAAVDPRAALRTSASTTAPADEV